MQLTEDLVNAVDRLSNRKGVVLLVLATLLFGIGPMIVLVSNQALYLSLPVTKILLLGVGLTLPPLAVASALHLGFRRHEALDTRAAQGIVVSACALTAIQGLGIIFTWFMSQPGFLTHVLTSLIAISLVGGVAWSEQREWLKEIEAGHFVYDEGDVQEFARAHFKQFEDWVRAQQKQRLTELLEERVPKRRRRHDDLNPR